MSKYSGKCDLADHIGGCGGYYDKNGKPVKFGDPDVHVYYSDEMKDFLAFKKQTGGVLYQRQHIAEVNEYNQDFVKEHCPFFDIVKHVETVPDKRVRGGHKEKTTYTYIYYKEEYTPAKLKKEGGVDITVEIHFETILDLIKYYPYIVTMGYFNKEDGKSVVYVSQESYVDEHYKSGLQYGHIGMKDYYDKELANHYLEVCRDYLLYKIDERTCYENIPSEPVKSDEEYYYYKLINRVDENHEMSFSWADNKNHQHWSDPQYVEDSMIKIHKSNIDNYLKDDIAKGDVKIKYVKFPDGGFSIL